MTINKAIKLLSLWYPAVTAVKNQDYAASLKLGLEALKRLKADREAIPDDNISTLPGETDV